MVNLLLSIMGAFAQFERELIRERRREGIALAKKAGAYRGRDLLSPQRRSWNFASESQRVRRKLS